MREYISGNIVILYPEPVVWLGDSNCVTISSSLSTDKIGGEIIIRHPSGTETRTIRHLSEINKLLFVLDDALNALADDNIGQYSAQVNVYLNGNISFTKTFTFQLLDGKSFTNQSHAISRTIYIYDSEELNKIQVFSPKNGVLNIENESLPLYLGLNQYDMSEIIDSYGTHSFCLDNAPVEPVAIISGDIPNTPTKTTLFFTVTSERSGETRTKGGDVWTYDETIFPVCYDIIYDEGCWNYDFIELRYRDSDGCIRYLGGKIADETNAVQSTPYERTDGTNCFRNIPRRKINGTQRTLKVGFIDVARNAYPQDILYSNEVYMRMYNSEWWPVTIEDESITTNRDESFDFQLNITISKE